jgi:hypothetical protein
MNDKWKDVAVMLTHFMYVADMGISPEDHGTRFCMICQDARDAYGEAMAASHE